MTKIPMSFALLDGNLSRFQVHGVVTLISLHGLCGDIAPLVEYIGGIILQLERDEFLIVIAVHLFAAAVGEIWCE